MERRRALGGSLPKRVVDHDPLPLPAAETYSEVYAGSGKVEASTTSAFVRLLRNLSREPEFGKHVVPIVPRPALSAWTRCSGS